MGLQYRGIKFSLLGSRLTQTHGSGTIGGSSLTLNAGIQCEGGTTDCTRTMSLGEPTSKQRELYTSVLQAHIRLAKQVFPEKPVWRDGYGPAVPRYKVLFAWK